MKRISCAAIAVSAFLCITPATAAYDHHGYLQRSSQKVEATHAKKSYIKKHRVARGSYTRPSRYVSRRAKPAHYAVRAPVKATATQSSLVAIARAYKGTNPTGHRSLWCADFMNYVLRKAGYRGTNSRLAKSFLSNPRTTLHVGAIAVLSRGKRGGHVALVSGYDGRGNLTLLGGNQGRGGVNEIKYPARRVIAYVLPA